MTWLDVPKDSAFGVTNLPYGVFSRTGPGRRVGVRIGQWVLDLAAALGDPAFAEPVLNGFLAQGRRRWNETRARVTELLTDERHRATVTPALVPIREARMHLPFTIGDYVDFYASEHHASNIGRMFRPDSDPLTPNWKHLPIGYHGRSGTIVVSGTAVRRPQGQRKPSPQSAPVYGPSQRLDIEAEVGFVVGTGSSLGRPTGVKEFTDHVFGVCLVNDWSARDIQAWEYVPLGPFLGKSFATSLSAWVVPLEALEHARVTPPPRYPQVLDYLADTDPWGLDLTLEVRLNGHVISRPPYASMYWTPAQMLAHMTANGASVRTGDLYASGTVSGPAEDQRGSLMELSWGGRQPITLPDGTSRTFLEDGDEISISATAPGPAGTCIGFGEVTGRILPAGGDV
ncbi:fumarylacetoacetase [Streptomyces milbemycinicus]|uniref:fumarylacetoacetase n=1 Tax=Streptomyces milbemycinicus TaxID=476552 RepID=UPI0033F70985